MSITGYRLGEGWVGHMDRVAEPQKMLGTGIYFQKKPSYRGFLAAGHPEDRRRQTVPLLRLRPTSVLRSFSPRPQGRLKTLARLAAASERRALALLPSCPPPAPTPSSHR
jgi:hypothetical protein